MLPPWMIDALRREQEEQARQDRESWDKQPRLEEWTPPESKRADRPSTGDGRTEGGILEVNFYI